MKNLSPWALACLAAPLVLPLGLSSLATSAQAQSIPDNVAQVSVVEGWRLQSGAHMAAIRIKLAPGWHTYWRAPGATGIPPRVDWQGSSPHSSVDFHWPTPTLYEQNGTSFLGYEDELILPFEIMPSQSGEIHVKGQIAMGVCEDVCLPFETTFEATLPAASAPVPIIQAALKQHPIQIDGARCSATAIEDGMQIKATLQVPEINGLEMAVLEHVDPSIWVSTPIMQRTGNTVTLESDLVPNEAAPFFVDRSQLVLTVIGDGTAYEAKGCTGG